MDTTQTPSSRLQPTEVANDTFVVHAHCADPGGLVVPVNALVIRAARPVVIDTGLPQHRQQFLDDVFALVQPHDIGWVLVTHDDVDHSGNLGALMHQASNAILLIDRRTREQLGATLELASHRQQWITDGDRVDIGDRTLSIIRPPVYDSPFTVGVFDPTTGVYWSADAFGTPLLHPVGHVGELDRGEWQEGIATFDHYTAPWLADVDERTFQSSVDVIEGLGASAIVGSHSPVIGHHHVHQAITVTRRSSTAEAPDSSALERIRSLLSG